MKVILSEYTDHSGNVAEVKLYQVSANGAPIMAATSDKRAAAKVWEQLWAQTDAGELAIYNGDTSEYEVWDTK